MNTRSRPRIVSTFAILLGLTAAGDGIQALTGLTSAGMVFLVSLMVLGFAGIELVVAVGLFSLKNWARIAFIVVVALNALFSICTALLSDNLAVAGLALLIGLAIKGYAIYWFATNEKYFKRGNIPIAPPSMPQVESADARAEGASVAKDDASESHETAPAPIPLSSVIVPSKGTNKWLIGAIVGGVLLLACVGISLIAYAVIAGSDPLASFLQTSRPTPSLTPNAEATAAAEVASVFATARAEQTSDARTLVAVLATVHAEQTSGAQTFVAVMATLPASTPPPSNDVQAYYERGNAALNARNYDQAILNFTKAIELDPKYVSAYNNRGNAYKEKDNLDQALADYNKAIELDPKHANAYNNRGAVYHGQKKYDQAILDYSKAIELDPKYVRAYYNRGNVYDLKGNFDQAIADYSKAIDLDPKYADAYYGRGNAFSDKGNLDQSIADYNKAIDLDPKFAKFAPAYNNRGYAYQRKGNLDQAVADYTRAIEIDSKYARAYINRGITFRALALKSQAIADFEMYLRLLPNASDRAQVEQWLRELKGQ